MFLLTQLIGEKVGSIQLQYSFLSVLFVCFCCIFLLFFFT